jgi:mannose-6-phosphate isomerase-like protein (cupin superfamily)
MAARPSRYSPEMLIRDLNDCAEFIAGDSTILRELLRPAEELPSLRYSLAHAVLRPGDTSTPHKLKTASEVYYILEGEGVMHIEGETARVGPGQAVYIPPDARQFIENTGSTDLRFLCIVDPAWTAEDEVVFAD